ncbi:MAG: hypothetical protein RIC95_03010 [Vicingaceae bacterium]
MAVIQLELEQLKILRAKKRWKLYFVVVTEHPEEEDKMVMTYIPQPQTGESFFRVKPNAENQLFFEPQGAVGADGLIVKEREMPEDRSVKVRMYLRHSRRSTRNAGNFLKDMEKELGGDALGLVSDILGSTGTWLVIAKKAMPMIGNALSKVKDRDFGAVVMDEEFGAEFENQEELDRENKFTSGDANIVWSWAVKQDE